MTAFSLIPMNRTDRLGSTSSGMPAWCRPTTPWSASPTRIAIIELVKCVRSTGILLQGSTGRRW